MRAILIISFAALLLAACYVGPGYRHGGVVIAPALPSIVVLEDEPFYYYDDYYYYYNDGTWTYSRGRNGPWYQLPPDRYPHEIRFRGRGRGEERYERRDGRYERRGGYGRQEGYERRDGYERGEGYDGRERR